MVGETSLAQEKASLSLQVHTREAASSQDVASVRLLWTGIGFAALMLMGLSACALAPLASPASAKPSRDALAAAALLSQDDAFIPGVAPAIRRPEARHGHSLSSRRPASLLAHSPSRHSSFLPRSVRGTDSSSRKAGTRMTAAEEEADDADFQTLVAQLTPTHELPKLRATYRAIEQQMNTAVRKGDFAAATVFRSEYTDLRYQDPAPLATEVRQELLEATETGDKAAAAKYEEQLTTLKRYLPEYRLNGKWTTPTAEAAGNLKTALPDTPEYQQPEISIVLAYLGDKLTAKSGGKPFFQVDVSETQVDVSETQKLKGIVHDGQTYVEYFGGTGYIDGSLMPGSLMTGKLYLLPDGAFAFQFKGKKDGGEKVLQLAGGGGGAVVGGQMAGQGRAKGGGGKGDDGRGGGGGELVLVFTRS